MRKAYLVIFIIIFFVLGIYFFVSSFKNKIESNHKMFIKETFFPYTVISKQKEYIKHLERKNSEIPQLLEEIYNIEQLQYSKYPLIEKHTKDSLINIFTQKKDIINLKNNLELIPYKIINGFHSGIHNGDGQGSGFFGSHNENLFIISANGILGFGKENNKKLEFKQINNNIEKYINYNQYKKKNWFSIKGLHINNNKIFVSYTEEIKEDCWNTSLIIADLNYKILNFKKIFSSDQCIQSRNRNDIEFKEHPFGEFNAHQSGGKIYSLNESEVLLTIGDYRKRYLAQDIDSVNGKLITINIFTQNYEILSMGHRNPQGLFFDSENEFILETEHGPMGGDEINILYLNNNDLLPNYGWPIASYGEHYGGKTNNNISKYKKYPLLKSHKNHSFIEPLKVFTPSIGISSIIGIGNKNYITSSLKGKSIYFFNLDRNNKIENFSSIVINERVRDIFYMNSKLYLFLEDTGTIGVINLVDL